MLGFVTPPDVRRSFKLPPIVDEPKSPSEPYSPVAHETREPAQTHRPTARSRLSLQASFRNTGAGEVAGHLGFNPGFPDASELPLGRRFNRRPPGFRPHPLGCHSRTLTQAAVRRRDGVVHSRGGRGRPLRRARRGCIRRLRERPDARRVRCRGHRSDGCVPGPARRRRECPRVRCRNRADRAPSVAARRADTRDRLVATDGRPAQGENKAAKKSASP